MNTPWINTDERMPCHAELVFIAILDVPLESYQYYVGFYSYVKKVWYVADYGETLDVSFWMPIPRIKIKKTENV